MKDTLKPGITHQFSFQIPLGKTVPFLYPEAPEFQLMPRVLATGFMVGLIEWTCLQAIHPHLDWPLEQTLGTKLDLTHSAATPPGLTVTVRVQLEQVEGRRLVFRVSASDGIDVISEGTHERMVVEAGRFNRKMAEKAKRK